MKPVKMFYLPTCRHSQKAFKIMDELKAEHPEYQQVRIEKINEAENRELAEDYDYFYTPAFFIDHKKLYESLKTDTDEEIRTHLIQVFQEALHES